MKFGDLLDARLDAVVDRWGDAVLSAYPPDSAALFRAQQDPFANPLGASVRKGTRGVLGAMLNDMDREGLRSNLDEIIRIRAVQQMTPAEALAFVFSLRSIIRDVVPEAEADPHYREDLAEMDRKIDEVALSAFEIYAARREEVSELRISEVKRQVSWVMGKMNRRDEGPEEPTEDSNTKTSTRENVQEEDL